MASSEDVISKRGQVKKTSSGRSAERFVDIAASRNSASLLVSSSPRHNNNNSFQSVTRINLRSPVQVIALAIGFCGVAGAIFSFVHVHQTMTFETTTGNGVSMVLSDFKNTQKRTVTQRNEKNDEPPHYHTLQCKEYGGPSEEAAQELVYWQG